MPESLKNTYDRGEDESRSNSVYSRESQEVLKRDSNFGNLDEADFQRRKIISQNISIDNRDQIDRDSSYIKDFLSKLKHVTEFKTPGKSSKQSSSHKKTSSLAIG